MKQELRSLDLSRYVETSGNRYNFMISAKEIQAICDDIVRECSPLQVILFGSYAYGTPTEASDVDLLVVMADMKSESARHRAEISERIPRRFHLDLHVRSRADIAYRVLHNDWFLREVLEKGDVLYDTEAVWPSLELAEKALMPVWEETGVMNPLTLERVRKAEVDYLMMKAGQQISAPDIHDAICFHAQQCIEKYLKAWLQEANLPVPRTHDLNALLALIVPRCPEWRAWQTGFSMFEKYAVDGRYEGYFATESDAEHAVRLCGEVRQAIRAELQLPNEG